MTVGAGTNTVSLVGAAGGQNIASVLVVAAGNGLLSSTNNSGTNTYAGGIYLDSNLGVRAAAAGGTFALTGTVDVKSQTLTIDGPGVINAASGIQSSTGGGTVVYNGSGILLLNGSGNNAGSTTINSGTLGGAGSVAGPVNVNAATINPSPAGLTGTVGTLTVGALTLASTSTTVFDLASANSYDILVVNSAAALAGTLAINNSSAFATGTVFDLVRGAALTETFDGIVDGGFYMFGGQTFKAQYNATIFIWSPSRTGRMAGRRADARHRLAPEPSPFILRHPSGKLSPFLSHCRGSLPTKWRRFCGDHLSKKIPFRDYYLVLALRFPEDCLALRTVFLPLVSDAGASLLLWPSYPGAHPSPLVLMLMTSWPS